MEPYIFTIDNFNEKEENYPKLNLDSCDSGYMGRCHSYTSSLILDDDERAKSIGNETNQLSEIGLTRTNDDEFDLSRLASEV